MRTVPVFLFTLASLLLPIAAAPVESEDVLARDLANFKVCTLLSNSLLPLTP